MAKEYISEDLDAVIVWELELSGSSNSGAIQRVLKYVPASDVDSVRVSFAMDASP